MTFLRDDVKSGTKYKVSLIELGNLLENSQEFTDTPYTHVIGGEGKGGKGRGIRFTQTSNEINDVGGSRKINIGG